MYENSRYALLARSIGVICVVSAPLWCGALFFSGDYEIGAALIVVPILALLSFVAVLHVSHQDALLRLVMCSALLLKLAAAGTYLFLVFRVFEGGDVLIYFSSARDLAAEFAARGQWRDLGGLSGTNFIESVCAALIVATGATLPALTAIFAMASFWGQYLLWRAFRAAFPGGDQPLAAALLFFLPSMAFWTASVSKEALIMF